MKYETYLTALSLPSLPVLNHAYARRREVIGGGVGGPIPRSSALEVLDHDDIRVVSTDYGDLHKPLPSSPSGEAVEAAPSSSLLPLPSSSGLRRKAEGVSPLGKDFLNPVPFSGEAFCFGKGQEDEEEDDDGEDNVHPVVASHRKRRHKMCVSVTLVFVCMFECLGRGCMDVFF